MAEAGGEGVNELESRLSELSDQQLLHARALIDSLKERRRDARERGMNFGAPSADKLLEKLKGGNTPFLSYWVFNYRTPSPGTFLVWVGVDNPDPIQQWFIYVHFFVGPGSLVTDVGEALALADTRFPRATEPEFVGFMMAPFSETQFNFRLPISGRVEESHYFGNMLLVQLEPSTIPGVVLDRQSLVFKVRDSPPPP